MDKLDEKFSRLGTDNAPGQEVRQREGTEFQALLRGETLEGRPVDFSHGDVDAFPPVDNALAVFSDGYHQGGAQAYTEYRGKAAIRHEVAKHLGTFTGSPVDAEEELIITTGTQGALFLAIAACVTRGTKVAIVQPDYFANRKLVSFMEGELVPVQLNYHATRTAAGLDLDQLEAVFKSGVEVFLFSNPNNPTGVVYSREEIVRVAQLAAQYNVTVIVDQLYSRLLYSGEQYTHLRAQPEMNSDNLLTIMGPSKTESLSGFRLGVAFGAARLIQRMEKLQAIIALRAAGYNQAVLRTWFNEPDGWMSQRIIAHQRIRDAILDILHAVDGVQVRPSQAGSYLFPQLPDLVVKPEEFVRILRVQAGVTVTPGSEFGPNVTHSIRVNFSQDYGATVQAMQRVATLIQRYRK
ncbi:pyridoxal phosphate-dependent aminotransferase [Paenalcaligenes sp. Me52]|uniref:pyridoxal phosphate-dependent aminotransferase n=1 Tax=Paenalcaligenes sp. Me52 TaxID=3392038 RepID=UPI003D2B13AA